MFNRNINPKQFAISEESTAPAGGPPTFNRGGESIPFAGGTFNVAENLMDEGGAKIDKGAFITQSAQTVIPGTLSKGKNYAEFNSTPEQKWGVNAAEVRRQNPDQHIGITEDTDWGDRDVSMAVGFTEIEPVAYEKVGETIRHLRAQGERKRIDEDGGVPGFSMREWNALDDEGMTRRHFE